MFARERVVPGVLAGVGAVLAGVLVGTGFGGKSGAASEAVVVQAAMPHEAVHASLPDPADPSAAQGAPVGRRMAIAVRGVRTRHRPTARRPETRDAVARLVRPAATRPSKPGAAADPKRAGHVKADPPAPPRAARRSQRHHHRRLPAGRRHRHAHHPHAHRAHRGHNHAHRPG